MARRGKEKQVSILFADVSGFTKLQPHEIGVFVRETMGGVGKILKKYDLAVRNTWGDALFLVFDTATEAANCAFDLRSFVRDTDWRTKGILKPVKIRIALHNATAIILEDPILGRANAYGGHVNMTARLEPVAIPNEIFATESFKIALDLDPAPDQFAWDSVGQLALAKDWGETNVYRLRRPSETVLEPIVHSPSTNVRLEKIMPHAQSILSKRGGDATEVRRILEHLDKNLGGGLVRRNLTILLRYNVDNILDGTIVEHLQWNYELVNIRDELVETDLSLKSAPELSGAQPSYSYHVIDEDGSESPIFEAGDPVAHSHLVETRRHKIVLKPKQTMKVELRFQQEWPVNPKKPWIHNSFQFRHASFQNRLHIIGPLEDVSVICGEEDPKPVGHPQPDNFVYNIPSPLFPEQGIEILLKFKVSNVRRRPAALAQKASSEK
jgi:class 3 adenylate cyclase